MLVKLNTVIFLSANWKCVCPATRGMTFTWLAGRRRPLRPPTLIVASWAEISCSARHLRIEVTLFNFFFGRHKKPGNYRKVSSPDNTLCFPPPHGSFPPPCCDATESQCAHSAVSNRSDTSSHEEARYHQRKNYSDSWPQSLDLSLHHTGSYSFSRIVAVTVYASNEIRVCLSLLPCVISTFTVHSCANTNFR